MRAFIVGFLEVLEIALVAVGAVLLIRNFLVQPFLVSGSSMVPNFYDGDYLLIDELSYRLRAPERGEIVVFKHRDTVGAPTYFIKRIIGLPGEHLRISDNRVVVVSSEHPEGLALNESYLPRGLITSGKVDVELAPGEYFVMGDNRSYSYDSRSWGSMNGKDVVGLVRLRLWPATHIRAFAAPEYH